MATIFTKIIKGEIGELINQQVAGRQTNDEITIFKSCSINEWFE